MKRIFKQMKYMFLADQYCFCSLQLVLTDAVQVVRKLLEQHSSGGPLQRRDPSYLNQTTLQHLHTAMTAESFKEKGNEFFQGQTMGTTSSPPRTAAVSGGVAAQA